MIVSVAKGEANALVLFLSLSLSLSLPIRDGQSPISARLPYESEERELLYSDGFFTSLQ
jgi:hypothetical protein